MGAYHGANPGMGWLFAVALGLQERSRRAVLGALVPIAAGHALAVAGVALFLLAAESALPARTVRLLAASALAGFAVLRLLRSHHFRWVGMRVTGRELVLWSFLMSSVQGAGLMLVPVLLQCHTVGLSTALLSRPPAALLVADDMGLLLRAVAVHTVGLVAASGAIALLVYDRVGLGVLRRAWVNLDQVWALALLAAAGAALVA